jgi:hypothetical protein
MRTVARVTPHSMSWCVDCHAPQPSLRPVERVTDMDWSPGADADSLGRALAERSRVRRLMKRGTCQR